MTVDPDRDTDQVMSDYAAAFTPQMVGLRGGRNEPVAVWPSNAVPESALLAAVDGAVRGGRMVVQTVEPRRNAGETTSLLAIGYPVTVDGLVRGAAGVLVMSDAEDPQAVIDRIAWGCGWIEALLRRRIVSLGDLFQLRAGLARIDDMARIQHDLDIGWQQRCQSKRVGRCGCHSPNRANRSLASPLSHSEKC